MLKYCLYLLAASLKVPLDTGQTPIQENMKNRNKEQFNARLRPEVRDVTSQLSLELNFTNEELVEVCLAALIGTKDNVIEAKRLMAQNKAKELKLSFERAGLRSVSAERMAA